MIQSEANDTESENRESETVTGKRYTVRQRHAKDTESETVTDKTETLTGIRYRV